MEKVTELLLTILFVSGSLVSITCIYVSSTISIFLGTAVVTWVIIVITVFVIMVYEIYESVE